MRIDEMVLKANLLPENEGKTYFCNGTDLEYSKEKGFTGIDPSDQTREFTDIVLVNEWLEKPKRHLTVSEAEKELDCVIDVEISKLLRSPDMLPEEKRNVVVIPCSQNDSCTGYCKVDCFSGAVTWYKTPGIKINTPLYWIDPADLIKLLSKE